jgi:starvation-inducible DNA-binding protein
MQKSASAKSEKTPASLATPTDLKPRNVTAVATELNRLVADAFALYVKTKNFHWHLSGPHFRGYHLMLDEHAQQILATIDPLAERVRKLGERTILGIGHIGELATITDNDEDFVSADAMLKELLEDNQAMAASMRHAHGVCDDNDDPASASLLENYIDETEKRVWFLFESTRRSNGSAG